MLKPQSRWIVRKQDEAAVQQLAESLEISSLAATLLVNRGFADAHSAEQFMHPENGSFHDPFLFSGMETAVRRIKEAVEKKELILVYGDYDADGVTSTSVLITALRDLGAEVRFYIPNRFTEGYGPNSDAFKKAAGEGVRLIITVDNGIAGLSEARLARELGMDLIITDHHEPGPEIPEALAIIHPNIPGEQYPFKGLAGVGVAFKLAHALYGELPIHLLDLAVIGTIADLVPLTGENRIIASLGLRQLAQTVRPGLQALCKEAGAKLSEADEESVGFVIGPRLNAAGRLGSAEPAARLLMTEDPNEAHVLAVEIDAMNTERKELVAAIAAEAAELAEEQMKSGKDRVIVVCKPGWNAGVIGIVASKLVEAYYRPVIVLSCQEEKGLAKGSARSIPGFDLFENLSQCRDILPHFGGHTMAAGMTLAIEDVEELRKRMNDLAARKLSAEDLIPAIELDAEISLEDINLKTIEQLDLLAPYGMGNPKPQFLIKGAEPADIRKIGASKNHLKLNVQKDGHLLDGVGFGLGGKADEISPLSSVSLIGQLAINEWNNIRKPQMFVKDLAVEEWQLFDFRGHRHPEKWVPLLPENRTFIAFDENTPARLGIKEKTVSVRDGAVELDQAGPLNLVLLDLPPDLETLEAFLNHIKHPDRIYAYFYHENENFFSTMPTRDHFKWYYAFLAKQKTFDYRRLGDKLASYRGWSKETVKFMSRVFFELEFVTIKDGIISLNPVKFKKDLSESPTYRRKQAQFSLENELIYSSHQQLKQWFDRRINLSASHEEETKEWI